MSYNNSDALYNDGFFESLKNINLSQAKAIVPIICNLVDFESAVDFGCGVGCWLRAFQDYRYLEKIHGLDGEWLRGKELLIDENNVEYVDLSEHIELKEKYDLVISLEVAEHLPAASADSFVDNLTLAGDVILFSAAIPYQGGTGHINEQWPDYWDKKFYERGFVCFDVVRPLCWDDDNAGIYRQNIFLYVHKSKIDQHPKLLEAQRNGKQMMNLVAPFLYNTFMKKYTSLLDTSMMLIEKESEGRGLSQYLNEREIQEVAIYGMAELGVTLLKYLQNKGITVKYGIDKKQMNNINGISVYKPDDLKGNKLPIIISTVPNAYDDVCKTISMIDAQCEVVDIATLAKRL